MENFVSRDEFNGLGSKVNNIEKNLAVTESICVRNTLDINTLTKFANGLLIKVAFLSCLPVVVTLLIQLFNK